MVDRLNQGTENSDWNLIDGLSIWCLMPLLPLARMRICKVLDPCPMQPTGMANAISSGSSCSTKAFRASTFVWDNLELSV
ncbi:unnamed protein product [Urochloa humidicola]